MAGERERAKRRDERIRSEVQGGGREREEERNVGLGDGRTPLHTHPPARFCLRFCPTLR